MKTKLFYGWYIVIASLLLAAYHSAIFTYGWTAFVNPIIATFGWSLAQLSLASSLRTLETGAFNPIWGTVVDRWSPRKLTLFGVMVTGLGMLCLSQTRNLAMYYGGFLVMGLGSSLITGLLPPAVISRWFRKDIGKANGLFYMGVGIGGVLVPLVVIMIDRFSWQTTLLYGAIGSFIVGIPLLLIIRSRPEDYGLLPDGKAPNTISQAKTAQLYEYGTSIKQLLKMRVFWYLGLVNVWQYSVFSTLSLYAMPYLTGLGMERSTASMLVSLYTFVSLFGRIPVGILSDIFRKSYVLALSVGLMLVGLLIFWLINSTSPLWLMLLFGIIYGIGLSGMSPLRPPILAAYFGTKNFGTIFGVASLFGTLAMMVSQPLAGWIYDTYHDFKLWWLALVAFGILTVIVILIIPPPKRNSTQGILK